MCYKFLYFCFHSYHWLKFKKEKNKVLKLGVKILEAKLKRNKLDKIKLSMGYYSRIQLKLN